MVPAIDLRPFGWAVGGYSFRCIDCTDEENQAQQFERWGAKRAWRCEKHAEEAWERSLTEEPRVEWPIPKIGESAPAAGAPKTAVDGAS